MQKRVENHLEIGAKCDENGLKTFRNGPKLLIFFGQLLYVEFTFFFNVHFTNFKLTFSGDACNEASCDV